jgi:hypothetical protein
MRPDSEKLRADARNTPLQRGRRAFQQRLGGTARRESVAHEPLIVLKIAEEVPLAGLSFRCR